MYINIKEAAILLGFCPETISSLAKKKILPYTQINKQKFFIKEDIINKREEIISKFRRNIDWNYNFFNYISPESLYWAGFILADGNLCVNLLKIQLKYTIENNKHLNKLRKSLKLPQKYVKISNKKQYYSNKYKVLTFGISYIKFPQQLIKWGIIPNKTQNFLQPSFDFSKKEFGHFLRGWFDGDGYCRKDWRCIQLVGNRQMIFWLKSMLEKFKYKGYVHIKDYKKDKPWCCIDIGDTEEFISLCHGKSNLKLSSKWKTIFGWSKREKHKTYIPWNKKC